MAEIVPQRAVVRPRVYLSASMEIRLLEDVVEEFAEAHARGAIQITGPAGSGKTTALQHLAAVLGERYELSLFDDLHEYDLSLLDELLHDRHDPPEANKILVATTTAKSGIAATLLGLSLASWSEDDCIEYLLAMHPEACGSVMARLRGAADEHFAAGNPELTRIVLDRMAGDESVVSGREALGEEIRARVTEPKVRELADEFASAVRLAPSSDTNWLERTNALREEIQSYDATLSVWRLVRHEPIQSLLVTEYIARTLADGSVPERFYNIVPCHLVSDVAEKIADNASTEAYLRKLVASDYRRAIHHPPAASLLNAMGHGWRPEGDPLPCMATAILRGADWPEIDLFQAELTGADLTGSNLCSVRLSLASMPKAVFDSCRLRHANLDEVKAAGASFVNADLSSASARHASFQGGHFASANLDDADLSLSDFLLADLTDASFQRANLRKVKLAGTTVTGATFAEADFELAELRKLNLSGCDLNGARFRSADLRGCNLEGLTIRNADFSGAVLRRAHLTGSTMPRAVFELADLRETGLAEIHWEGADLREADLRGCTFHMGSSRSGLVDSPLASEGTRTGFYSDDYEDRYYKAPEEIRKANLRGADLRGARIDGVDFYLVDLREAQYDEGQREQLERTGAILFDRV